MDKKKTRLLLDKISAMFKTLEHLEGPLEPIERDLMLSYIRQLYAAVYEDAADTSPAEAPRKPVRTPESPRQESKPINIPEHPPKPAPTYKPAEQTPEERPAPPPPPKREETARKPSGKTEKLFAEKSARELGDKLSNSRIADLRRAFTINDRLLYMNELFGKDQSSFEKALNLLNQYDSFQEARSYIEVLANQFNWLEEERIEIAQDFVRTIRRRYL